MKTQGLPVQHQHLIGRIYYYLEFASYLLLAEGYSLWIANRSRVRKTLHIQ